MFPPADCAHHDHRQRHASVASQTVRVMEVGQQALYVELREDTTRCAEAEAVRVGRCERKPLSLMESRLYHLIMLSDFIVMDILTCQLYDSCFRKTWK